MPKLSARTAGAFILTVLLGLAWAPWARADGLAKRQGPRFNGFIVQFKPGSAPRQDAAARQRSLDVAARTMGLSMNPVRRLGIGADLVRTNRKLDFADAERLLNRLRGDPDVLYAELDRVMRPTLVPNDTYYANNQWHYFEPTGGIGLPATWDRATGSGVVVAVLDTGITAHSDLAANVVAGYDFITDAAAARDGDGRDADPSDAGDWVALGECDGEPASNSSWHGTHVAGTPATAPPAAHTMASATSELRPPQWPSTRNGMTFAL